ncbi:MAG: pyridoxine 5-phosphate synthase [Gammaproteobacteria bacterium]|jgi:pyridoxine 5-phosphate synthase
MTKLSVNLNKVALLRNQRDVGYPNVVEFACIVIDAGADGITVHPRPDERHIRRSDVYDLAALIRQRYSGRVEFNVEGNPTPEFMALVADIRPQQVTLVPDDPDQSTSDHGWDPGHSMSDGLADIVSALHAQQLRVALFMDPDIDMIQRIHNTGADRIELYTGPWAEAFAQNATPDATPDTTQAATQSGVLSGYVDAARCASELGFGLNAGHDLNLDNLAQFKQAMPALEEVSIGHAITADALRMGFATAVARYKQILA